MKPTIASFLLLLLCPGHVAAETFNSEHPKNFPTGSQARQCVVTGKTWQECLGLPRPYSITDSVACKSSIDFSQHPFTKLEAFKFRPPWGRSAVDFLVDPNFHRPLR